MAPLARPAPPADDPLARLPTDADLDRDPVAALARLPTDLELPYSDGEPMDSPWHRSAISGLIDSLAYHWRDRGDYFVGGDMFVYFSPEYVFHKDFRGPDFFVVRNVPRHRPRRSWVSWQEGGRLPDLIIELTSESTAHVDRGEKWHLYSGTLGVPEYFIYDPADHTLTGWRLNPIGRSYGNPLPSDSEGRIQSNVLGLSLGSWEGSFQGVVDRWPRFFTADGRVVPVGAQAEFDRAEQEKARADALAAELARLRAELAARTPPQP